MKKIILIGFVFSFLFGCKTRTMYVPIERVKIEYKDRLRIDSVFNRDTFMLQTKNDTVFSTLIRWREKFVKDTVRIEKKDSIPYPVEIEIPVNYLTKWQKIRLTILNIIVAIIAIYISYIIGKKRFFRQF